MDDHAVDAALNIALCVNPKDTYAKVKAADGYTYYLARLCWIPCLADLAKDGQPAYEVLETMVGTDLEYREYEPLCTSARPMRRRSSARRPSSFTCDDYVTMSDGTGIVHIAPAFR